ncbi:low molecular weight phosphotyrosine protein phosphatase [Martelella alba]|uniref:protein-tyrosine-phosphatase n=1 Tax=Martelella alba TaxID=2590451 RepID=A0A506U3B5_9HYPH|nr:low molecular weight protein-tyrosine-phosphatase [Martelella alba]TPW27524.1 low molecular weight phosphotyrosine protein phosphatase [Martelella alba]
MIPTVKPSLLFVCTGNICRSPLAEGVFVNLAEKAGRGGDFIVDSAGTGGWHEGELPDPRSRAVARTHGFDISNQRARKIKASDFQTFSLILAMDRGNLAQMKQMSRGQASAEIVLFRDFTLGFLEDVPDPYYGGAGGFDTVYDMLVAGCQSLISKLS